MHNYENILCLESYALTIFFFFCSASVCFSCFLTTFQSPISSAAHSLCEELKQEGSGQDFHNPTVRHKAGQRRRHKASVGLHSQHLKTQRHESADLLKTSQARTPGCHICHFHIDFLSSNCLKYSPMLNTDDWSTTPKLCLWLYMGMVSVAVFIICMYFKHLAVWKWEIEVDRRLSGLAKTAMGHC